MRIGIDTHFIRDAQATGNRTYTAELIRALVGLNRIDEFILYTTGDHGYYRQFSANPRVHIRPGLSPNGVIRNFISIPYLTGRDRLDVLHLQFILPWMIKVPTLLAIHDLYYTQSPAPSTYEQVLSKLTIESARRANHIVTLSEYSRRDIINRCGVPENRVTAIPLAAHQRFSPLADPTQLDELKKRLGIDRDYLLFVGRTEDPRKNISILIDAYVALCQAKRINAQLVIAGRHGPATMALINKIQSIHMENDILFPGIVSDEELPILLSGAQIFIYVSSFEGFGLPVLEAMSCGTPTITSNTTSLPEVAGDAAITVTPGNLDELMTAIARLLQDKILQDQLRRAGLERAKTFSWEQSAKMTHRLYTELNNGNWG